MALNLQKIDAIPYFLDAFTATTAAAPQSIMFVDDTYAKGITRARVNELSAKVYAYLKKKGIGKEDFVLIRLPRGSLIAIAMIGVWKAGAALTVVEANYAEERIAFIKKDCNCKLTIDLDTWQEILNEEPLWGYVRADLHDAAFAVYTSGSTGIPKGILHEYGNIKLHLFSSIPTGMQALPRAFDVRYALIVPLNFIASMKSIISIIYGTYTLYLVPYEISKNPKKLREYYLEEKISATFFAPTSIRAMKGEDLGPYLKTVQTGGEPANGVSLENITLLNTYGMSEGAFTLCQFIIDKPYEVCPVGKPINDDIEIHLLDEDDKEVKDGEIGEIAFENPFFRGYINMPEETKKAMRGGLYHSGDLAVKLSDGNFVVKGRSNDMIKINGNRIEPAEIEAVAKKVLGIHFCAAKGFVEPEQSFICLYYTDDIHFDKSELMKKLEEYLPYYMIPSHFMRIESIPTLPNGKLDRKALPKPKFEGSSKEFIAPRNDLEKQVCAVFASILKKDKISVTDDFYDLGGDSLSSMELLEALNLNGLSAMDIFHERTPERIAAVYQKKYASGQNISEEEKEMNARKEPQPLTPVQFQLIDAQLYTPRAPMWNFPFLFTFPKEADVMRIKAAAEKVMANHPIFGSIFEFGPDNNLRQRYDASLIKKLEIEKVDDDYFQAHKSDMVKVFKIVGEPMIDIRLFVSEKHTYLLINFHHIIMDGSSMQIIFTSLAKAYAGEELPLDTYYSYLEDEKIYRNSEDFKKSMKFFYDRYGGDDWCRNIEPDKAEPGNINEVTFIPANFTPENMDRLEKSGHISRNGIVLAITQLALAKLTGKRKILLSSVFHYRMDERKQAVGSLISRTLPVGFEADKVKTLKDLYDSIHKQSLDDIANSACNWTQERERPFITDAMPVVYETSSITGTEFLTTLGASMEQVPTKNRSALQRTIIQVFERPDSISVMFSYMSTIYSRENIEKFSALFCEIADKLVNEENPEKILISDLLA